MQLMPLPCKPLADTGLTLSSIGLGTVKLGRDQGVKYPEGFQIPDDRAAASLINRARKLGINLVDTAPAYGRSEERLGQLFRQGKIGARTDWLIATKVGEEFETTADGQGRSFHCFTPEHVAMSLERSLQRLGTDYLDLVLVHSDGHDEAVIRQYGILEVLAEYKVKGLIRATGMSTKTVTGGLLALDKSDCAMVTWNLQEQGEKAVLDYAAKHNKGILVKKALASGHLCLGAENSPPPQQTDPVQAGLDFVYRHPAVTSVILGTINPDHLAHNVACAIRAQHA